MSHRLRIATIDRTIEVPDGLTLLEAALDQDVAYPFACHSGTCGTCKTRLISGKVRMLDHSRVALSEAERAQGLILACSALPLTDCEVAYADESALLAFPLRKIACRIVGLSDATHDIKILSLAVTDGPALDFAAGQFASLAFADTPERDYSMANAPGAARLEFHVRRSAAGVVSEFVHRSLKLGDRVTLRGPYGASFLRKNHAGPILALAGGSGLAPIKSIVETALAAGMTQPIRLYIGVRDERDLYLEAHFSALARTHDNLTVIPVLSEPTAPTARRTGYLADAVAQDIPNARGLKAYLAGPPIMVDSCSAVLARLGLEPEDCHADPFYTEAEKLARAER